MHDNAKDSYFASYSTVRVLYLCFEYMRRDNRNQTWTDEVILKSYGIGTRYVAKKKTKTKTTKYINILNSDD